MSVRSQAQVQVTQTSDSPLQTGILQRQIGHENSAELDEQLFLDAQPSHDSRFQQNFSRVSVRSSSLPIIQPKLKIGQPGDRYEQEADRVADQVMQMPDLKTVQSIQPVAPGHHSLLQRQPEITEDKDEDEEEIVQTKPALGQTPSVTPDLQTQLRAGGGQALPQHTREAMESRFHHDFRGVRVHSDRHAANLNHQIHAQAFTQGQHIYFGQGHYQPNTFKGQHLLAHELTHVVQQTGSRPITPLRTAQHSHQPNTSVAQSSSERVAETPSISPNITSLPSGNGTVQAFLDDFQAPSLEDVTNTLSAGAEWAGEQVSDVAQMGADAFMAIVERIAPQLAEFIRNGPEGTLSETIGAGIRDWVQNLLGDIDIGSVVASLQDSLSDVFANLQGVLAGDEASCAAFAEGINSLRELATAFMENPAVQAIQEAFNTVKDVFQQVSTLVLAPIFNTLMEIAGGIFDQIQELASSVWEWGGAIRDFLSEAWSWVLEQLGISGDSEGGILDWLTSKASEVWEQIKETFAPIIEPLQTVLTVMLAFSPVGPFLAAIVYGPQLIEAIQWLWNNRNNPDIVRAAHEEMGNTILPQLLDAAQGFGETLQTTVNTFVEQVAQISESVLQFLGAITGVPFLDVAQSLLQSLSSSIQDLVTWSQETFKAAADGVRDLFARIQQIVEPYAEILSSLAVAIVNPAMIPVILAGWAWRLLPDCYKLPIIDFLLDTVIGILEAIPALPTFGLLWPIIQSGLIGFLQGFRNLEPAAKIAVTDKLAKIISGASPAFIFGFVKGLLQGLWEGLTDPFVLIHSVIQGLGNLITWLNEVADQAMSPTTPPSETATTSPGSTQATSSEASLRADLGERLPQMADELQPPVEEATGNFMPALGELFSGGEGMSFEELMQKLGEAWTAVETAIRGAAGQLAQRIAEFLQQDSAEGDMGEAVGWLTGTIVFEVILGILTAATWQPVSAAGRLLQTFARILDWTGEALGAAFRALSRIGSFIMDGLRGLRRLLSNAGGMARRVLDAIGEIGQALIRFADELLGRVGREAAETGAERTARETAEAAGERSARETAEVGGERGARETADDAARKAAEYPAALAAARAITETNDRIDTPVPILIATLMGLKSTYQWIERFEARPHASLGYYSIYMIASESKIEEYSDEITEEFLEDVLRDSRFSDEMGDAIRSQINKKRQLLQSSNPVEQARARQELEDIRYALEEYRATQTSFPSEMTTITPADVGAEITESGGREFGEKGFIDRAHHDIGVEHGKVRAAADNLEPVDWHNPRGHIGGYGQGFDDIMRDSSGNLVIVEYKGNSRVAKGQMTRNWVEQRIEQIRPSNPSLADELEQSLENGTLTGRVYTTPIDANGSPLPTMRRIIQY